MFKQITYEQALAKLYTEAEAQLIKTIKRKTVHGNATVYERLLLRQVDEQIKALQKSSDKIVQKLVKSNYRIGLDKLMQDISVDKSAPNSYNLMSRLNTNQINIIVDNITTQLHQAIATVGRRCDDYIRQAALSATAKKLTTGQTVRQMQRELESNLVKANITSIEYANGTEHNIKDYATMVARTTTAETQNTAQLVQGNAWGYDLVRMTSHYPTCEVCAMYQDRVYATTKEASNGKYKDRNGNILRFAYIYDTVLIDGYNTVHPNCRHRFAIFPPNAYTLDELAEFSRQSMQPFADTRSDEERKVYAAEQAVKRKRNASRRQYEKIKRYLPDNVPKTFAAWQRMKSANSQRYQDLISDYRIVKKTIANGEQSSIIKAELNEQELSAINTYISSESYKINEKLRSGEKLNNNEKEFVNNLDSALSKIPNYEGTVYRSLSSDMIEDIDDFWRKHSNDSVVKYNAFTSTSTSTYDDSMDIQMVIKSKYGKDIRKYNPNESEILFNKDALFYISEVKGNMIFMEEI